MGQGEIILPAATLVALGVGVRCLGIVLAAGAMLPGLTLQIRLALALALAAVSLPQALVAAAGAAAAPPAGVAGAAVVAVGEAAVGAAMGAAIAAVLSAGAWAGGMLGSVAGLSWADDFDPEGDAQAAGMARFGWWISCGVFLAGGGLETIVGGVVESLRLVPVGAILPADGPPRLDVARLASDLPAVGLSLALALAVPALLAVVAFHLATAVALRTVPFVAGAGFLQSLAALVLLGAISLGADAWARGFPALVEGPIERALGGR